MTQIKIKRKGGEEDRENIEGMKGVVDRQKTKG